MANVEFGAARMDTECAIWAAGVDRVQIDPSPTGHAHFPGNAKK